MHPSALRALVRLAIAGLAAAVSADEAGLDLRIWLNADLRDAPAVATTAPMIILGDTPFGGGPSELFSARFTGRLTFPTAGRWTLTTVSDDGVRLWIDRALVIDHWDDHAPAEDAWSLDVAAGQAVELRLDYYQRYGGAVIALLWQGPDGARVEVPSDAFSPAADGAFDPAGDGFAAAWYANPDLLGSPVTSTLRTIDFDLHGASPVAGVPPEWFSARFLATLTPPATGDYTFSAWTDDGVRLWIDGTPVIDDWTLHPARESTGSIALAAGRTYALRVEYLQGPGDAVAQLRWQGPATPRSFVEGWVHPGTGFWSSLRGASAVSPMTIEAQAAPGVATTTTVDGSPVAMTALGDDRAFVDVALSPTRAIDVAVAGGSDLVVGDVAWTPTDVDGRGGDEIALRAGDALLLRSAADHLRIEGYGGAVDVSASAAGTPYRFDLADHYRVVAVAADGSEIGSVRVVAIGITIDPAVAGATLAQEVGSSATLDAAYAPSDAADRVVVAASGSLEAGVTLADGTAHLTVTPRQRRFGAVVARIAGSGAILGRLPVRPFAIEREAMTTAYLVARDGDVFTAESFLRVRPLLPNLSFHFSMFAHSATFLHGATAFDIGATDATSSLGEPGFRTEFDPATGEDVGVFRYSLLVPDGETSYCHRLDVTANY